MKVSARESGAVGTAPRAVRNGAPLMLRRRFIAARSAIAPYRRHSCRFGNGASLRRDMLFWNCGIVKMSHYGIVALELDVSC